MALSLKNGALAPIAAAIYAKMDDIQD